jgi:hypothetical protein
LLDLLILVVVSKLPRLQRLLFAALLQEVAVMSSKDS